MKRERTAHELVGKRVQVPVYTDAWMMGDRFGKVMRVSVHRNTFKFIAHVMLDKSNRTIKFVADDCEVV
jgi:hypothetical protein